MITDAASMTDTWRVTSEAMERSACGKEVNGTAEKEIDDSSIDICDC